MSKPIVCIDFDGVVHSYTSKFNINNCQDPPVPGAFDAIRRFQEDGWDTHIYSSRSHSPFGLKAMREWLIYWSQMENDTIGCGLEWMTKVVFPQHKPPAFISIDDRAFQFDGKWGLFIPKELRTFKPWNKR